MFETVLAVWAGGLTVAATSLITMLYMNAFRAPKPCTKPHGGVVYRPTRGLGLPYAITEAGKQEVPYYQARHRAKEEDTGGLLAPRERGDGG